MGIPVALLRAPIPPSVRGKERWRSSWWSRRRRRARARHGIIIRRTARARLLCIAEHVFYVQSDDAGTSRCPWCLEQQCAEAERDIRCHATQKVGYTTPSDLRARSPPFTMQGVWWQRGLRAQSPAFTMRSGRARTASKSQLWISPRRHRHEQEQRQDHQERHH